MKKRCMHKHSQRGYALIAVIGVMALLVVFVATIQGSLGLQVTQSKVCAQRLDRQESLTQAVAVYGSAQAPTSGTLMVAVSGQTVQVVRRNLGPLDPLWDRARGINYEAGDAALELNWTGEGPGAAQRVCIVNTQGRRQGVLVLPRR